MPHGIISIAAPFTSQFLQSSQRLSASEIAIAREFIAIGEHCLSYVEAAISRTGSGIEVDGLMQQREDIREQVLEHKKAIRCIRCLPPEIISKFLVFALLYVDPDDFGETPWHLGHVCRYWRDVALASPSLWTDIVIVSPKRYPVEKLQTLLTRSSNSPLKFLLWATSTSEREPRIKELLQTMIPCSHRWTNASISINPKDWALLAPLRGRIPLLRYLRIDASDFEGFYRNTGGQSRDHVDPFQVAPALRDVTLEDLAELQHPLVLPFHQLTRLKMTTTADGIGAVLKTTPNLEMASIDLTEDTPHTGFPPIRLAHLRRLYISSQEFLNYLELPALQEIYMVDTPPAPFLSLVERCPSIKLTTLRLAWCSPTNLPRLLEACPTVQTLGLQLSSSGGNKVLAKLTVKRTGAKTYAGIGSNVHSISICLDRAPIDHGAFVKMVESRWRVPAEGSPFCRLRSVELVIVNGDEVLNAAHEQKLDVLRAEGLQVSVLRGSEAEAQIMEWRI